ncbi:fatty acid synthase-like, partial [Ceratina calcarata]|uniref:Fatty acid synthase-like n=1 Tax=Ceratina calcarata TaxID=156304 RepID=A0AAJ7NCX9_9HYME
MAMKFNPAMTKPGEEIVISGIAGKFPESDNVEELKTNLMNKVDLITDNSSRYPIDHMEVQSQGGKIRNLSKFDEMFFGIHLQQSNAMDPIGRILLETTYEAIIDAGINPKTLKETNTGVIVAACFSESEGGLMFKAEAVNICRLTGLSKSMLANRLSYFFGLRGPSYTIDTACSSSMFAIDQASRLIQQGICDAVIVGGGNLTLLPYTSMHFNNLGVLSKDCRCRSFDSKASGYVRSEAIGTILLQKAKNAKRIYAQVVHSKSNSDGYKEQGITFPSSQVQKILLTEVYKECKVSPHELSYLEGHATGTVVGDPEELNAIDQVFCQGRSTPLKIGSVKSNMGHTEAASGLCSVIKVIIAMESGLIPPNLHFTSPTKGVKCFEEGKLQVITEPTPWEGGYVGISSFGFGGSNAHVLLKSFTKEKVNNGAPSDDLPRLVAVSGRTEEAVKTLLDYVESIPVDVEYIRLLHDIHNEEISGHLFRGYTLVNSTSGRPIKEIQQYPGVKRPIWFVFSGMGSQWPGMGEALMKFPIFYKAIQKCAAVLKPHGVDIFDILTNKDKKTFDNILNSFVGIAAVQIGLVDLLTSVGIEPDNIIGHSVGELGCAYADGCFTAEQMVLAAYSRGLASIETKMIRGSMAAVGLGYKEIKDMCPPDIEVACHNSSQSSTISGPAESMKKFVAELTAKNIFAREVACSNIAYHSRYIAEAGTKLLAYLKKVIPEPKRRSSKWLSSSVPQTEWSKESAKYSSAEYHTNNLLNSVLFEETAAMIPSDAIAIEIAPHGLLQAIVKRSLGPNVVNVPLTLRGYNDNAEYFLQALGKLYNAGLQPQLANLYPYVEFPVSRGTPMISPYVRWEHSEDLFVLKLGSSENITTAERNVEIVISNNDFKYMAHHVIDGRNLLPATGYLVLVWETFSMMQGKLMNELSVIFEDVKFERASNISSPVFLSIMIHRGSGKFEISEKSTTVVTGSIREMSNPSEEMIDVKYLKSVETDEPLTSKDIYKELKLRGYEYTEIFCSLKSASIRGTRGRIAWYENWAAFMDNMLQIQILGLDTRALYVPTGIQKLAIDVKAHSKIIQRLTEDSKEIPVSVYKDYKAVIAGGIEMRGIEANSIQRRKPMAEPVLEEYKFVANRDNAQTPLADMIILSTQLALESHITTTPKILEIIHEEEKVPIAETLCPIFMKVLSNLPMVRPNLILCAKASRSEELSLSENVTVIEENKLPQDASVFMAAACDIISSKRSDILEQLIHATEDKGFILLQESGINKDTFPFLKSCGLNIVLEKSLNKQTLLLLKKEEKPPQKTEVVHVNNNEFSWIEKVKMIMKNEKDKKTNETTRLVLVAEGDMENGLLGMVKCLRREPNGEIVKAVIIQDKNAPKFSLNDPFYSEQLDLNIAYNVLRPGRIWGTYRHVPYPEVKPIPVPHGYVNLKVRGDLSSIQWMQGPIQPDAKYDNIVKVVYASLNFRDVMLATGKLMPEAIASKRESTDCLIGFEFSGIDSNGRRVMGFVDSKAISNLVTPDKLTVWPVPDEWSLEDAATIPSAYFTVLYAFFYFGKLKKGEKVLIHAGSGAVGQAAINVALAEGCEVFTTVGTPEKRKFIKETFP